MTDAEQEALRAEIRAGRRDERSAWMRWRKWRVRTMGRRARGKR